VTAELPDTRPSVPAQVPLALKSNDQLGPLVPCPMCDSRSGYALKDGSTYRWWDVFCVNCGRTVDECASDRRTQLETELPDRWPAADVVWNAAGAHAANMRADRDELAEALADLVPVVECISGDLSTTAWHALEMARHVLRQKRA